MKKITAHSHHHTILIYGPSGGGKTSLSATAPKPIILDSNQGVLSLAGRPGLEHLRSHDVFKMADLDTAYENCLGVGKKNWSKLFRTISFDHFDDIQQIVMEELGDKRKKKRGQYVDEDEAEQRDYGIMGNKLRRLVRKFKPIPMYKILICGEQEDRETGRMRPSLVGALKGQLPYLVDHTLYLRIGKKDSRWIHLNSTDEFFAKTRAWWLPNDERIVRFRLEDTKCLTKLLSAISAGPTQPSRKESPDA